MMMGGRDAARRRGQLRAVVKVDAHASSPPMAGMGAHKDWEKERVKSLGAEIAALEKQLAGFDPKEAAEQVRKALDLELRSKKLELEQQKLRLERP